MNFPFYEFVLFQEHSAPVPVHCDESAQHRLALHLLINNSFFYFYFYF